MRIAVVSDTHGGKNSIELIKNYIKNSDVLIHLGDNIADLNSIKEGFDGKVFGVSGNCDYSSIFPTEQIIDIGKKKIFITHGHNYGVKYGIDRIFYKAKELGVDAVLFGHTHIKMVYEEDGLWIINPGSAYIPKDGSASIAFIEIEKDIISPYTKVLY